MKFLFVRGWERIIGCFGKIHAIVAFWAAWHEKRPLCSAVTAELILENSRSLGEAKHKRNKGTSPAYESPLKASLSSTLRSDTKEKPYILLIYLTWVLSL